jgi:hypothetical protein
VELIETSTFTRQITALLSDEDYGTFQNPDWQQIQVLALSLRAAAQCGRFGCGWLARQARGRPSDLLLANVSADLTPKQVAQLATVVKEEFRDETENV